MRKLQKSQRVEKSRYPSSTHATNVVRIRHVVAVRVAVVEVDEPRVAGSAGRRRRRPKIARGRAREDRSIDARIVAEVDDREQLHVRRKPPIRVSPKAQPRAIRESGG